jgi:Ribbon-helix-helix domain
MPQKKDTGKRVFTGVYFDRPQHDALRALSGRTRVPLAAYLREAVDMLLVKYGVKPKAGKGKATKRG